jgi:hypothetical protein
MTSWECYENKWFYMKYIGKYLSEEILLTRECSSKYSEIINQPFNGLIYSTRWKRILFSRKFRDISLMYMSLKKWDFFQFFHRKFLRNLNLNEINVFVLHVFWRPPSSLVLLTYNCFVKVECLQQSFISWILFFIALSR